MGLERILSSDNDNDDNDESDVLISRTMTEKTEEDEHHSNIPPEYTHKSRTQHIEEQQQSESTKKRHRRRKSSKTKQQYLSAINQTSSPSPHSFNSTASSNASSTSSSYRSIQKKDSNNISMLKILDAKPLTLDKLSNVASNAEDPRCSELMESIFDEIYFSGNWNRGSYAVDTNDDEYKQKKDVRRQFYRPLTVFGDDEMFERVESQKRQNREQQC